MSAAPVTSAASAPAQGPMSKRLLKVTGGAATVPLLLLWGLNMVDELDRTAFGILIPEIRDHFEMSNAGILGIVSLVSIVALLVQPIMGVFADRRSRTRLALGGAAAWAVFSFLTGLVPTVGLLIIARLGSGIGRAVNDPTHNSLLADYYEPDSRVGVYGFHRSANYVGQTIGPLIGGGLAALFTWRAPFLVFWLPTAVLVLLGLRHLQDPIRGYHERVAGGADEEASRTEEDPPTMSEAWRLCMQVGTLRRIWLSLPALAISLVGFSSLSAIFYEETFALNEFQRGMIEAALNPFQIGALLVGIPLATRYSGSNPALLMRLLAAVGAAVAAALVVFALSPNVTTAVIAHILVVAPLSMLLPGLYTVMSMVIPPRARGLGFGLGSLFVIPGLMLLPIIGSIADNGGARQAMVVMVPVFLLGSVIISSAGSSVNADVANIRSATAAQAAVSLARARGESKLLVVQDLDVAYGSVQVLFGVDFEVEQGEVIALLGTNGAGKSTLLRAISGLQPAKGGAVIFDGQNITHSSPQEVASRGVIQVPGGKGVFPGLTVEENLRIAGWLYQREGRYVDEAIERVLDLFPVLRQRFDQPAGLLSGGEQQMVTLSQAFIAKPRILMIDELSLGLAPVIVEQLLKIVREMQKEGITLILVEQSVNVALTVAETAYFMEKGEIRFKGPTKELLERPDVLRSVFLEGAAGGEAASSEPPSPNGHGVGTAGAERVNGRRQRPLQADPVPVAAVEIDRTAPDRHGPAALEVTGLVKTFGGISATDEVSFRLEPGEIVGFIGPNGAGKTTLFDQISGYLLPDRGRIEINGIDVTTSPPDVRARLGLGRSFQDARLFPSLTVRDTIALALERRLPVRDPIAAALHLPVVAEAERAVFSSVDDLIELMGLGAFTDKFVGELSTGSRRVVDLACIVAHEPEVILFDEPSSGIAQRETEALGPLIKRIQAATSASVLVIEHDMPLITSISDRLIALDLGRVIASGAPTDVINHPTVVSAYLGTDDAVIARSGGN